MARPFLALISTLLTGLLLATLLSEWPHPAPASESTWDDLDREDPAIGLGSPGSVANSEIPQADSASLREVVLPGARNLDDPDDPLGDLEKRLYVDRITRASHPLEYDAVITAIARKGIRKGLARKDKKAGAMFCGFQNWDLLESELDRLETTDPTAALELRALVDDALSVAALAADLSIQACDDPFHFEARDPDDPGRAESFRAMRDTGSFCLYRFSTATTIGDRSFFLHFDSQFFPDLETRLEDLVQRKEAFWQRREAR